jgi:hypothetical protein
MDPSDQALAEFLAYVEYATGEAELEECAKLVGAMWEQRVTAAELRRWKRLHRREYREVLARIMREKPPRGS